jgi:hypothetical protein
MSTGAKSRLAEAIAAATSTDGRRIDRARLAELLETKADDPLLLIVEVACLTSEGGAACRDKIMQGVVYLDHRLRERWSEISDMLDRHRASIQASERSTESTVAAMEAKQDAVRSELDGRLRRLDRAAEELGRHARQIEAGIAELQEKGDPIFSRKAIAFFAVGLVVGALLRAV